MNDFGMTEEDALTESAVDLMEGKTSAAERPSRGEARLRRRADGAPLTASRLPNKTLP
jgi:hypothetical protein